VTSATILVAEDDRALRRGLVDNLLYEGYRVLEAEDGEQALESAVDSAPDLLVLDVGLPRMSGFEVCRALRERGRSLPILMLTARSDEQDVVLGLNLGADDYVTKPFGVRELVARVKALLRRRGGSASDAPVAFGPFVLDHQSHRLLRDGAPVDLTPKEWALLVYLAENRGRALSREQILAAVWGMTRYVTTRSVDRCVTTLRKKIEVDPRDPRYVATVRETGYRFEG